MKCNLLPNWSSCPYCGEIMSITPTPEKKGLRIMLKCNNQEHAGAYFGVIVSHEEQYHLTEYDLHHLIARRIQTAMKGRKDKTKYTKPHLIRVK